MILRRKNEDPESDKYSYFIAISKSLEITTPFKNLATKVTKPFNDWKPC